MYWTWHRYKTYSRTREIPSFHLFLCVPRHRFEILSIVFWRRIDIIPVWMCLNKAGPAQPAKFSADSGRYCCELSVKCPLYHPAGGDSGDNFPVDITSQWSLVMSPSSLPSHLKQKQIENNRRQHTITGHSTLLIIMIILVKILTF